MPNPVLDDARAGLLDALPEAPPRAQWRLLEAAFAADGSPGGVAWLMPLAGLAAYAVSFRPMWLAWALAALALVAVRLRLAAMFEKRSGLAEPMVWAKRHRIGAWAQAALLGVGAAAAVASGNLAVSLMACFSVGVVVTAQSAVATLSGTARVQAALALGPVIVAGVVAGQPWPLALAALCLLQAVTCIMMAERAAASALAAKTAELRAEAAVATGTVAEILPPGPEDFQRLMGRDQLTGLPNQQGFMHILAVESRRAHGAEMPLSLLIVSLDGLPEVVGPRAQLARDTYLSGAADTVKGALYRVTDQLASLSPGRFAVLLPFTDALGADVVARKIVAALRPPAPAEDAALDTGALAKPAGVWADPCIGVATYCGKGVLPETQLLEYAMEAESAARKKSTDRIARHDPLAASMRREGESRTRAQIPIALIAPPPKPDAFPATQAAIGASDFASGEPF